MSLRRQLLFRVIVVSILLVGSAAWFGYKDVGLETRELFDGQLARSARLILSLAQAQSGESGFSRIQKYLDENGLSIMYIDFDESEDDMSESGQPYETKLAFQIWDNVGNLLVKSYNAPLEPMASENNGFSYSDIDDFSWRTFTMFSRNGQYRCITAERIDVRNDLIGKISQDLFYLFIILVPALALLMYLSIDHGLKPLQRLASQIDNRSGDNLDFISNDYRFSEMVTIKNALNHLLRRLKETLAREKRITSDAAHELRTPLAAIRLHTELAKTAKNQQQKNESLDHIIQSVDRTTHLVEQLLTLARLEPELLSKDFTEINLSELVVEECVLISALAIEKNI
ncbi:MAG: histidine kinase dimerization/phospho-acceptor domain-containing protein, partial [Gammaproteobacteria bacterium]|nr:histidine kinase dimerization/phospho-acceptor domain-containing protein [Gammaproteobacteria bacterium]